MTLAEIQGEIRRQIVTLQREQRRPVEIRLDREWHHELMCDARFLADTSGATLGGIMGWRVNTGKPGELRVIPADWQGDAQGMARPGGAA